MSKKTELEAKIAIRDALMNVDYSSEQAHEEARLLVVDCRRQGSDIERTYAGGLKIVLDINPIPQGYDLKGRPRAFTVYINRLTPKDVSERRDKKQNRLLLLT